MARPGIYQDQINSAHHGEISPDFGIGKSVSSDTNRTDEKHAAPQIGQDYLGDRKFYLKGKEFYLKGKEIYLKGKEIYLKGKEIYLKGKEIYLKGKEIYLPTKREYPSHAYARVPKFYHI